MNNIRTFAFYLPQFHPIPENNIWHGEGFTEWTNVGKAKPLFRNHYQPRVPADLGYYDLRVSDVREKQAELARNAGIEGFVYWHYWFGNGKKLLQRPIEEVLLSGKPDFPFCFAWANDSWKGVWHGKFNKETLIEQTYPGIKDIEDHFYNNLPYFLDERYIKVDNKPLFIIYKPLELPECNRFIEIWNDLAIKNGLKGIFFIGQAVSIVELPTMKLLNLDAINIVRLGFAELQVHSKAYRFIKRSLNLPRKVLYKDIYKYFIGEEESEDYFIPTIIPNWDHSPRSGAHALILHDSNPEIFEKHLISVVNKLMLKSDNRKIAFIKSWNEWAEGNYLEPDLKFGNGYLDVCRKILFNGK
jgi:hypothetical protein